MQVHDLAMFVSTLPLGDNLNRHGHLPGSHAPSLWFREGLRCHHDDIVAPIAQRVKLQGVNLMSDEPGELSVLSQTIDSSAVALMCGASAGTTAVRS